MSTVLHILFYLLPVVIIMGEGIAITNAYSIYKEGVTGDLSAMQQYKQMTMEIARVGMYAMVLVLIAAWGSTLAVRRLTNYWPCWFARTVKICGLALAMKVILMAISISQLRVVVDSYFIYHLIIGPIVFYK